MGSTRFRQSAATARQARIRSMFPCSLFIAKSNHRIHPHGAVRGNVAGGEGNERQDDSDAGKGKRVHRTHTVNNFGHQARQSC